jgi:hypothetical protein
MSGDALFGWSPEDWTAISTTVLAVFTAVLSVSTIGLWYYTRRQAQLTSESVRIAKNALVDLERPWVFVSSNIVPKITHSSY